MQGSFEIILRLAVENWWAEILGNGGVRSFDGANGSSGF